jgi:hypothetical protein
MEKNKIFISFVCFFLSIFLNHSPALLGNTKQTGNLPTNGTNTTQLKDEQFVEQVNIEKTLGQPVVWITFLPTSPIRSISEFSFPPLTNWIPKPTEYKPAPFPKCDLEIRRAGDQKRIARIPNEDSFTAFGLTPQAFRRIGQIPDGEYLAAFCIGDKRYSNVAQFTVDSHFDPITYPTLSLIPLEPAQGYEMKFLGMRTVGPTPKDRGLTDIMIGYPNLIVDGVERHPMGGVWSSPIFHMEPGRVYINILEISNYGPEIESGQKHTIKATTGNYESAPIEIPTDNSLGRQWDKATKNLLPVPPQKVVLEGKFIGTDGKTCKNYVVSLRDKNNKDYIEYTDEQGKYIFFNIPSGEYRVQCDPNSKGLSGLIIEKVTIDANKPLVLNFNIEKKYNLTGTVVFEDGKSASGINVLLYCRDVNSNAEFHCSTKTDENGRYELGSPFGKVSSIGIVGSRNFMQRISELKPGMNELNFVLRKNDRGLYEVII